MGKTVKSFSFDAKKESRAKHKNKFKASSNAERQFYSQLKKVAKASAHIVESHTEGAALKNEKKMMDALKSYSELIEPWATRQSAKLLEQVSKSNKRAYKNQGIKMNSHMKAMEESNVGRTAIALLNEQVALISRSRWA